MALETASYVANLVESNPDGSDARNTADDHLRLIKAALKRTFPLLDAAVSLSATVFMRLADVSASVQAQINALREGTATANNAVNARFANSASLALTANSASYANSASAAAFARSASFAYSASSAVNALFAASASFAYSAVHALSANFALTCTSASGAAELGGVAAAAYVQSGANDLISATWSFADRPQFSGAGGFLSHANAVNNRGAVTVTSISPSAAAGNPGDIFLVF